jgi:hypothetical protein
LRRTLRRTLRAAGTDTGILPYDQQKKTQPLVLLIEVLLVMLKLLNSINALFHKCFGDPGPGMAIGHRFNADGQNFCCMIADLFTFFP